MSETTDSSDGPLTEWAMVDPDGELEVGIGEDWSIAISEFV